MLISAFLFLSLQSPYHDDHLSRINGTSFTISTSRLTLLLTPLPESWSFSLYESLHRYFSPPPSTTQYPPEVHDYNDKFTALLHNIKKRHDPTVTTVAQGVLEWKKKRGAGRIGQGVQEWLDRFYMSRIGIRFLIGQRELMFSARVLIVTIRRGVECTTASPGLCRYNMYKIGE
jgi:hypothetical protein